MEDFVKWVDKVAYNWYWFLFIVVLVIPSSTINFISGNIAWFDWVNLIAQPLYIYWFYQMYKAGKVKPLFKKES